MSRKYPTWLEKIFGVKAANKEEAPAPEVSPEVVSEATPEVKSEAVSDVVSEPAPEVSSESSQEEEVSHTDESTERTE